MQAKYIVNEMRSPRSKSIAKRCSEMSNPSETMKGILTNGANRDLSLITSDRTKGSLAFQHVDERVSAAS